MSDESLTNTAVEWMRRMYELAELVETPPTSAPVTDDFRYTDRRTGGTNYGSLDASGWQRLVAETWRVGSGRPTFAVVDVIAVRGEWSAAIVELTDFGDDSSMSFITCFQLDAESRLVRRHVNFDVDDRDAAIEQLDLMCAEIADEPEARR